MTVARNLAPAFTKQVNAGAPKSPSAANTKSDGTGTLATDIFNIATIGTNDTWIDSIDFFPVASAAGTAMTATVARAFWSTVGPTGSTTTADTHPLGEVTLPALTADSASTAVYPLSIFVGRALPAGAYIHVTNHAAPAANTGWRAVVNGGGDY